MEYYKLFVLVVCVLGYTNAQFGIPIAIQSKVVPFAKELLGIMVPKILLLEYNNIPTREGYRFNYKTSDGSYREEVGIFLYPGTPKQELVVMGAYGYNDGDTETATMYTADKNGYKPRVQLKKRGKAPQQQSISDKCLKSLVCG